MSETSHRSRPPMTAQDVASAVAEANVPTLLAVLVQLSGDRSWLTERYRPHRIRGLSENDGGGLAPDIQAEIRAAASTAIANWLDGAPVAIAEPSQEFLRELFSFSLGEDVPPEYSDYLEYDLTVTASPLAESTDRPLAALRAVIIGAGVSGIAAGIRLRLLGVEVTVLEKTHDIGGTWNINKYPGCGVDTPSHLYSYSFAPGDWEQYYASQPELKAYLQQVAEDFDVAQLVQLDNEVVGAQYCSATHRWTVRRRGSSGPLPSLQADILISAVGAFGRPSVPAMEGLHCFAGSVYHTADWPTSADVTGKRIAVIGNGASAMQFVPAVAASTERLTIFQRTPQWAAPFEQFHTPVPDGVRDLMWSVPLYRSWHRARLGWIVNDKIHASLQIDPDWPDPAHSINTINDGHRRFFTRHIESELDSDTDLLAKVLPHYPPFGKRMLLDNGWFRTLRQPNVELITEPIVSVDETGIHTADARHTAVDVIVLATGFDVVHYLAPMEITGTNGRTLSDVWDGDDARAYLGMTIPGFPNLFCFYGPNGAPGHGGSFINTTECQLNYLVDLLITMRKAGAAAVDCRQDVHDAYNARVDATNEAMIWSHPGVSTYYRNSRGRVVYTNPWRIVDFWHMTRQANLDDYHLLFA
jgi:4-hydroxyacetophenone monooxygenase